jgi:hypothetical protein
LSKVTIIIGLPGSGKTTFLNQMFDDRKDIYHHDWGWKFQINNQGEILGSANEEYRFNDLIQDIKNSKDILMDGSCFCNHKFLCETEYHLRLNFPGIEITRFYFENNPEGSIANILYREYVGGNHWKVVDGELIFFGHHFMEEGPNYNRRMYEMIIENVNKLSPNYVIPSNQTILPTKVQDEKFYQGWRTLIRE